jgi:ABC-type Fe3+-hydroxamate transport system substrate-binding protein
VGFGGDVPLRSWDTLFLSVCDVLDRRARGLELVAEFESRLEDLAVRRSAKGPVSAARIEFHEPGTFSYRGLNEDTAALMKRLGIRVLGPPRTENAASLERLAEIDADWLIVPVGGDNMPRAVFEEASATELYKKIPAVAAGRVHIVDGALWPGLGHLWARAVADDLERLFVA